MEPVPGTKLGPYEIVSRLGVGGMGEVWRARDSRLNREVAIKVTKQQFTDRSEREAHAIAALNHPNICTIHDLGPNYLVMELIEGPTLAERIAQGPLPMEEALVIAGQIADALEAAHEKGIVHRDLKPGNIKIRPDGSVKVLDFGLAKAGGDQEATSDSPTMMPGTQAGMILGTAGYMSPEQARGQKVDKRADIWAFGVVLYEMVTSKRLFGGETVSDSLVAILKEEPDLTKAPEKVRRLLRACLEKDSKMRLRDIGDWRACLPDLGGQDSGIGHSARAATPKTAWILLAAMTLLAAGLAFLHFRETPEPRPVVRTSIEPPEHTTVQGAPALSPDGRQMVFAARSETGPSQLYVRDLGSLAAQPLAGTEGAIGPFWSPDSKWIGFASGGKLKKIPAAGGPVTTLADAPGFLGGAWSTTGVIVFAPSDSSPLRKVPEAGGEVTAATSLQTTPGKNSHSRPSFLPDGKHFLYRASFQTVSELRVGSLAGDPGAVLLDQTPSGAVYGAGYLLYMRDQTLMARAFDADTHKFGGEASAVAENFGALPTTSANGALLYMTGTNSGLALFWRDRDGKKLQQFGDSGTLGAMQLSPDGRRAAVVVTQAGNSDIWIYDLERNLRSRFTADPAAENNPTWSPDGKTIVFSSDRKGHRDLFRKAVDSGASEELLYADGVDKNPQSWSPDGKYLLYGAPSARGEQDIYVLPVEVGEKPSSEKPRAFLNTEFDESNTQFSPDGRWVAYQTNESGRYEIYVTPFPGAGGKTQVSAGGGRLPRWRPDGKELLYISEGDRKLMSVAMKLTPGNAEPEPAKSLFGGMMMAGFRYDVAAEGNRFLVELPAVETVAPPSIVLVQNWMAGLKK
jgi:Tol biopolymer transport system component